VINEDSVCYKHVNRSAAVGCQRCDKPICANCMNSASVGFHCPDCSKQGAQKVYKGIPGTGSKAFILAKVILGFIAAVFVMQQTSTTDPSLTDQILIFGPSVENGEWWRIITSGFAHNDFMHIAFNGYAIWILGQALEPVVGRVKFGLIFMGGLLGASLAVLLFDFTSPTLGASGAVMGLVAGLAVLYQMRGMNIFQSSLGFIIALNLGLPLILGGISFWGHLGGLFGGAVVSVAILYLPKVVNSKKPENLWNAVGIGMCLAMFAGAYFAGTSGPVFNL